MTANFELIGFIAGLLTTFAFLPLVIKVLKTKSTAEFSNGWLAMSLAGLFLWAFYGLVIQSLPVIFFNFVSLIFVVIIVSYKLSLNKLPNKVGLAFKRNHLAHISPSARVPIVSPLKKI